ncbi:MAG: SAM-dependent methyltransferase [Planctomycetota bacterium]|jgi:SAM-dependent methyltransferase
MKVAVLVVSRNRPDLVRDLAGWLERSMTIDYDLVVVEAGTEAEKLTEHTTLHYEDADFRGKCLAHNLALDHARNSTTGYDYYWVLMNDLVFDEGVDAARILIESMERDPRLAILSPTCKDKQYPSSGRQGAQGWRAVTTCDYLGFMMRASAVEKVGFLNPDFRYCWGAIHELSYKLYQRGLIVAYSDDVEYQHLGGTTYGAKGTNTISREEYQVRAKRFAYSYFAENYGIDWAKTFWAAAQGHGIEVNTYADHFDYWESAFEPQELSALKSAKPTFQTPQQTTMQANQNTTNSALRLHLGCGPDRREGWVNVDVNPEFNPDIIAPASELPMLDDASCSVIESCHLFEHLTLAQARAALREWRRLLAPGGELCLELPNFARCMDLVGTEMNGYDLGMISIFGYPPEVDEQGEPQLHKWGWTPESLAAELLATGFENAAQVPITQTERPAAKFNRDMRLVANVAQVASPPQPAGGSMPAAESTDDELDHINVFAWPNYADSAELDNFFGVFARVISGREDVCLRLRVDSELDGPQAEVIAALEASHARILGSDEILNIALFGGSLTPEEWREAGKFMLCRIQSNEEQAPRDGARQMPTPVVADAEALSMVLSGGNSFTDASF